MEFPIKITDLALEKMLEARRLDGEARIDCGIRISLQGGGCSGWTYQIFLETDADPEEDLVKVFEYNGDKIRVIIDEVSQMYLMDITVDYEQTDFVEGFRFRPGKDSAVKSTCGCGNSVGY